MSAENIDNPSNDNKAETKNDLTTGAASRAEDGYRVGNKHPPRHAQFQAGRSGNPRGRPLKSRNLKTDLLDELSESIPIRERDRHRHVSKQRALLKTLVNRGLGGDVRAIAAVFALIARLFDESPALQPGPEIESSDATIIERFIARKLAASQRSEKLTAPSDSDLESGHD